MFKITAICVAGVGSSVFCKELLGQALDLLGYDPKYFTINAEEVSMARGVNADAVVTSEGLYPKIENIMKDKKIPVVTLVSICKDPDKMAEGLKPYIEKAEAEGKVFKKGAGPAEPEKKEEAPKEKKKWSLFGKK